MTVHSSIAYRMISFLLSVRQSFRYFFLSLYILCIATLSLLPPKDLPHVVFFEGFDKVVHFLMYLPLSVLLCWVIKAEVNYKRMIIVILCAVCWGMLMEYMQKSMHWGRSFSWFDELANFTGAILGILLYWVLTRNVIEKD